MKTNEETNEREEQAVRKKSRAERADLALEELRRLAVRRRPPGRPHGADAEGAAKPDEQAQSCEMCRTKSESPWRSRRSRRRETCSRQPGESAVFAHSLFNAHPRFFGYITSSPAPIGILGELLAAALNPNVGAWRLSPAATEVEAQTVRWIAELIGFPVESAGLLVSGGNMANIVCLMAARMAKADWDVRTDGVAACVGSSAARLRLDGGAHMDRRKPSTWRASALRRSDGLPLTRVCAWASPRYGVRSTETARRATSPAWSLGCGLGQHRRDRSAARHRDGLSRAAGVVSRRWRIRRLRGSVTRRTR